MFFKANALPRINFSADVWGESDIITGVFNADARRLGCLSSAILNTLFITEYYVKQYRVPPESSEGFSWTILEAGADRPTGLNSQTQPAAGPTGRATPPAAWMKPLNGPCGRGALLAARASASHGHAA